MYKEYMMTIVDDLLEKVKDNIDNRYYSVPNDPIRCVLNRRFGLVNIPGYAIEIIDSGAVDRDLLFIADKPNQDLFHHGLAVLSIKVFENRCLWVDDDDITYIKTEGFYI